MAALLLRPAAEQKSRQNLNHEKGNDLFRKGNYLDASKEYSKALELATTSKLHAVLLSNRSGCYYNLKMFKKAVQDCDACIEIKPRWYKVHYRRGLALMELGELVEARRSLKLALKYNVGNAHIKNMIVQVRNKILETKAKEPASFEAVLPVPDSTEELAPKPKKPKLNALGGHLLSDRRDGEYSATLKSKEGYVTEMQLQVLAESRRCMIQIATCENQRRPQEIKEIFNMKSPKERAKINAIRSLRSEIVKRSKRKQALEWLNDSEEEEDPVVSPSNGPGNVHHKKIEIIPSEKMLKTDEKLVLSKLSKGKQNRIEKTKVRLLRKQRKISNLDRKLRKAGRYKFATNVREKKCYNSTEFATLPLSEAVQKFKSLFASATGVPWEERERAKKSKYDPSVYLINRPYGPWLD